MFSSKQQPVNMGPGFDSRQKGNIFRESFFKAFKVFRVVSEITSLVHFLKVMTIDENTHFHSNLVFCKYRLFVFIKGYLSILKVTT